jgi:hypothetical protein
MTMLNVIAICSLLMCILNWLLFVGITLWTDIPELKAVLAALKAPPSPGSGVAGAGVTVQQSSLDPIKLAAATGNLAGAFKKAGSAPTAAALSVLFLLVALAAAAAGKF